MELRIAFRRGQAVLGEQSLFVEVDRVIDAVGRRIDVDDLEILSDRTGSQGVGGGRPVIPRNGKRRLINRY